MSESSEHVRNRQLLLILDNFEQLIEESPLVAELLMASPGVKALVTSRVPLHLSGEHELTVPAVPTPSAEQVSVAAVTANPAAQIIVDRVRRFDPSFAVTTANAADIAVLCATLDGLPLALELAAAPRFASIFRRRIARSTARVEQGRLRWLTNKATCHSDNAPCATPSAGASICSPPRSRNVSCGSASSWLGSTLPPPSRFARVRPRDRPPSPHTCKRWLNRA
ncbi:MAG: hypothetical protein R2856_15565 [Caldilineaceae bacterium]